MSPELEYLIQNDSLIRAFYLACKEDVEKMMSAENLLCLLTDMHQRYRRQTELLNPVTMD